MTQNTLPNCGEYDSHVRVATHQWYQLFLFRNNTFQVLVVVLVSAAAVDLAIQTGVCRPGTDYQLTGTWPGPY